MIRKESIILDVVLERGAEQQVGMECQEPALGGQRVLLAHTEDFARRKEYHRGHGIIIILPAATATTVRTILYQQDGIEFELYGILFQFRLFQIDKAHLRMQRLAAQTMTTFAHGLYVQCLIILFHSCLCHFTLSIRSLRLRV